MDDKGWSCKLENQKSFFKSGNTKSVSERLRGLRCLQKCLKEAEADLLEALSKDLNKPSLEAFLSEIYFVSDEIDLVCKKLTRWTRRKRVKNPLYYWPAKSWVELEPFGAALIIGPWNYPVQLSLAPVIAAVAAGNTVILKPSEITPEVEKVLVTIISKAFSPEWVSCVTGGVEVSEALLAANFDFVFFTGSTAVGRKVDAQLAGRLIPRVLELGGKCPCVVEHPKSLKMAASRIVTGKFFNGGQTCFSPDFIAVHSDNAEALIAAIEEELRQRYSVDVAKNLAVPPTEQHAGRIIELRSKGDSIVVGEDKGRVVAPSIVRVEKGSVLLEEEIFGPLLPVVSYASENELMELLEHLESPLALYIFAQNGAFIDRLTGSFASGSVCVNDTMKQSSNLNLPFGGVGASGMGRYRGKWGVEQFSYLRAYTKRYMVKDIFEVLPPYDGALERMKKLLRWK